MALKKSSRDGKSFWSARSIANYTCAFLLGSTLTTTFFLNTHFLALSSQGETNSLLPLLSKPALSQPPSTATGDKLHDTIVDNTDPSYIASELDGLNVIVAIVAFDFSQLPHLEEVLDGYFDLCAAGSNVDVVVYSTVPWPVTLIDLLNTRFQCTNPSPRSGFTVTIHLKEPSVRLHLVDAHRELFYQNIDKYDLFIFSEDDIRVSVKTVALYLSETRRIAEVVGPQKAPDFNVGIARYEYNYPPDILIDDKTRRATQNVTRVYWEHSWHPTFPNSVEQIPQSTLLPNYVHMKVRRDVLECDKMI
jgi:hypothetical protein